MKVVVITGISVLLTILFSFTYTDNTNNYSIKVKVTKIRNKKGNLQIQVYRDQATFADEKPYKIYRISKEDVSNGTMTYTIKDLPMGTYGLALLDDENNNKEMDYGLVLPNEGFGFSNYYHTGWSRPVFEDFDFTLDSDKSVLMVVRYV